ncbi:hypothetical protein THIOKS13610002 [Thiocapsa sp. KS1]|nr:hypothetical protein THIOKS13610002 [Thiocapsa sp. KS1]
MRLKQNTGIAEVHCRIGSSEIADIDDMPAFACSLPHRQLRKGRAEVDMLTDEFTAA